MTHPEIATPAGPDAAEAPASAAPKATPATAPATPPGAKPPRGGVFRRLHRAREGSVIVEFSMVAIPFFGLSFATLETALFFFSQQVLETATADAARLVLTGQAQASGFQNADDMRREICSRVPGPFDCCGRIQVDVRNLGGDFGGKSMPPSPIKPGTRTFDTSSFGYQPSGPGDIVVVRAAMEYPIHMSYLASIETALAGGKRLVMASAAFRNEPFQVQSPPAKPPSGSCRNGGAS